MKYIYNKYNTFTKYGDWSEVRESLPGKSYFSSDLEHSEKGYSSYSFSNNRISSAGSYITITNKNNFGTKVYTNFINGDTFRRATVYQFINSHTSNYGTVGISREVSHSRANFLEEVISEEGIYPNNGVHSDGYWYVKVGILSEEPNIHFKINDSKKEYETGKVRVNGQLKQIDKIWTKIGGNLKDI